MNFAKPQLCLLILLISVSMAAPILAQPTTIYVIGAPGVTLSGAEIKEVFLGDKTFVGSTKLIPIDNASSREVFLAKVLGMNAAKYESIWTKKAFRDALNPPKVLNTDAEVIEYVKRTPGAVGYVAISAAGVTVMQKY